MSWLRARGLARVHRVGANEVRALQGVDLDLAHGEFVAIVGVSGSGKSTLLHLLGGLDTPTEGSLEVDGRDLAQMSSRERTLYRRTVAGFVFQSFYLVPTRTALDNVALALTFQGVYGTERKRRARAALERMGVEARGDHLPYQLSGGEQQRVALARAVVHRPQLLLADEPTGNLDRTNARAVIDLLGETRRALGTSVVLVTHDEEMARAAADRILRLRDGRVIAEEAVAR